METIIRVFPHTTLFSSGDELKSWLYFTLRGRDGYYYLKNVPTTMIDHTPRGSIVMFRYGDSIVGEAVVRRDIMESNVPAYQSMIKFHAYSIRVFKNPLRIPRIEALIGKPLSMEGRYYKLPLSDYGFFLNEVVQDMDPEVLARKYRPGKDPTLDRVRNDPPQMRIFPHDEWFPSVADLRTWLHFIVRERGGTYHFRRVPSDLDSPLTPGTIVLFRYKQDIVGDAVVKGGLQGSDDKRYEKMILFDPYTIRIYNHYLRVPILEKTLGIALSSSKRYVAMNIGEYGKVLSRIMNQGGFLPL